MSAIGSRPTPPAGVESVPGRVLRPDLDQVAVWRLAGRLPVSEVQLFEATATPLECGPPARAATIRFHSLAALERVTDPAELLNTAQLLATVAGWVGAASAHPAPTPGGCETLPLPLPLPLPFPDAGYNETA